MVRFTVLRSEFGSPFAVLGSGFGVFCVRGSTLHVAEGFGRFNPADFARFCVIARSSLMESQNHLLDLVDKRYINEEVPLELNQLAETALERTLKLNTN